jgi:hypothetical protein
MAVRMLAAASWITSCEVVNVTWSCLMIAEWKTSACNVPRLKAQKLPSYSSFYFSYINIWAYIETPPPPKSLGPVRGGHPAHVAARACMRLARPQQELIGGPRDNSKRLRTSVCIYFINVYSTWMFINFVSNFYVNLQCQIYIILALSQPRPPVPRPMWGGGRGGYAGSLMKKGRHAVGWHGGIACWYNPKL